MDINNYSYSNNNSKVVNIKTYDSVDLDGRLAKVINYFGETFYSVYIVNYTTDKEVCETFISEHEAISYFDRMVETLNECS